MTQIAEDTKILKEYVDRQIENIEKGDYAYITGGYLRHGHKDNLIESNCSTIVDKLQSLGYTATTNHGFGCLDYKFSKPIRL